MVTGATDGIGKSYAKQLAKIGLNIILVSRTQAKLDTVAAEIGNLIFIVHLSTRQLILSSEDFSLNSSL